MPPNKVAIARADLSLRRLRSEQAGEDAADRSTWDRASIVVPPLDGSCAVKTRNNNNDLDTENADGTFEGSCAGQNRGPVVLMVPVCFFRSRGCDHMRARFGDRVIFHHEFETSWRPSYWHNFHGSTFDHGNGPPRSPMLEPS